MGNSHAQKTIYGEHFLPACTADQNAHGVAFFYSCTPDFTNALPAAASTHPASLTSPTSAYAFYRLAHSSTAAPLRSPNDRPVLGCIGTGDRWNAAGRQAMNFSDCSAVCDVDRNHVEKERETALKKQSRPGAECTVEMFKDYRKLLDRKDIDVVTILTHNHCNRAAQPLHCVPHKLIGLNFWNHTVAGQFAAQAGEGGGDLVSAECLALCSNSPLTTSMFGKQQCISPATFNCWRAKLAIDLVANLMIHSFHPAR